MEPEAEIVESEIVEDEVEVDVETILHSMADAINEVFQHLYIIDRRLEELEKRPQFASSVKGR